MYPNKKYEKIFGPINEDVARAREKYDPAVRKLAGKMDSTLSYAPYAVMFEAFCKCGCKEALQKAFPSLWKKIFAVSLHGIVAQNSTAQAFPGWAFDNYCGLRSSISDSEISRLYSRPSRFSLSFTENTITGFSRSREKGLTHSILQTRKQIQNINRALKEASRRRAVSSLL